MPPPRKSKTKIAKAHQSAQPHERRLEARLGFFSVAFAALGVVLAYLWASTTRSDDGTTLSSEAMLAMVRRSASFDLASDGKRTLSATANIPAGTVLMGIPRELMM
jgi:hypothetical protein